MSSESEEISSGKRKRDGEGADVEAVEKDADVAPISKSTVESTYSAATSSVSASVSNSLSATESSAPMPPESTSSEPSAKRLKAQKLKGIGDGTDNCPYIIMIPPDKVGQIIGNKGATVSEIKARSGTTIFINQNFPPGVHRQISLTGSAEAIDTALYYIEKVMEGGPLSIHPLASKGGSVVEKRIDCPKSMVGKVIGPHGENIKDILHKSGARVQIHQDGLTDDQPRVITVTGTDEAVAEAVKLLNDILAGNTASSSGSLSGPMPPRSGAVPGPHHNGPIASTMGASAFAHGYGYPKVPPALPLGSALGGVTGGGSSVPSRVFSIDKSAVGKLIGKKGETVMQLSRETGCRIQVKQDVEPCLVEIYGSVDKVHYTEQRIMEIIGGAGGSHYSHAQSPRGAVGQGGGYGRVPALTGGNLHAGGYGGMIQQQAPAFGYGYGSGASVIPARQNVAHSLAGVHSNAPSMWVEYFDKEGRSYWYNSISGKTQWERPRL